jgi:hypothetical protein
VESPRPTPRSAATSRSRTRPSARGPLDLVFAPGFVSNIELGGRFRAARFLESLAAFARVIQFDKRGTARRRHRAQAAAGEVLVSRTARISSLSGLEFQERGARELKGVPGTWQPYAVTT